MSGSLELAAIKAQLQRMAQLIETVEVSSSGLNPIHFANIPQHFRNLRILGAYFPSGAVAQGLRFNGDGAGSYPYQHIRGAGTGVSAASNTGTQLPFNSGSTLFNQATFCDIWIGNYANTLVDMGVSYGQMTVKAIAGTAAGNIDTLVGSWNRTVDRAGQAVTTIDIYADASSTVSHTFQPNSVFELWGEP